MDFNASNLNTLWASLIVEELCRLGSQFFCIAPGSRSTPLTVAVARNPLAQSVVCYDERSAGFFALGYARATHKPAVLIVTSGTAVANLFPAIVEASVDRVPLIVLTADRPPELRHAGANQTIDQVKIFGVYARAFVDLPTPDDRIKARALLGIIDDSVSKSTHPLPGPVHLNCMFREPLEPDAIEDFDQRSLSDLQHWQGQSRPLMKNWRGAMRLPEDQLQEIGGIFNRAERSIIVAGAIRNREAELAILDFARHMQWPIFADVTSNLRLVDDPLIIHYADQLLLHPRYESEEADLVVQFGGRLTSKRVTQFLEKRRGKRHVFVDNHGERLDSSFIVTDRVQIDVAWFCQMVSSYTTGATINSFTDHWQNGTGQVAQVFGSLIDHATELSEPYVARSISNHDQANRALFLSSSMPIRDMDMFASPGGAIPLIAANRGASGIDGIISTACGFALGAQRPTTLLIGDLAFLHDGNGLSLLAKVDVPLIIVVINNRGGGIFSFLPIAKSADVFKPFFDTPHEHALEGLSHTFGIKHTKVKTRDAFDAAYGEALLGNVHCVIEVMSNTDSNRALHEHLKMAVIEALNKDFKSSEF